MKETLYDKIWNEHQVHLNDDGSSLLYIDRHLVHEVTSPQAFDGLKIKKRGIWNKESIFAVSDHNVPTLNRKSGIKDETNIKVQIDDEKPVIFQYNTYRKQVTYKLDKKMPEGPHELNIEVSDNVGNNSNKS